MSVSPLHKPAEPDPFEEALEAVRGAVKTVTERLGTKLKEAEARAEDALEDAARLGVENEVLEDKLQDFPQEAGAAVLDLAERLHQQDHPREPPFRFCPRDTCTAWNDLAREQGWR